MRIQRLVILATLLPLVFVAPVRSQSIERIDRGLQYSFSERVRGIHSSDVIGWAYDDEHERWNTTAALTSCSESYTILKSFVSLDYFRSIIDEEPVAVFDLAVERRSFVFHEFIAVEIGKTKKKILAHLNRLNSKSDSTYSPGAKMFRFDVRAHNTQAGVADPAKLNTLWEEAEEGYSYNDRRTYFGIAVFPVRLNGEESVRFYFHHVTKGLDVARTPLDFDKDCFDQGYFEMTLQSFRAFVSDI